MCGINGFNFQDKELLNKMTNITGPRGPDFTGYTSLPEYSVSHNRLAIVDTHARANQPYLFENLIISFNGEIYNHLELKKLLEQKGYKFKTTSDTEVIIKLFKEYGVDSFIKLSGIFAISIYDKLTKKLYLIRDVLGVKPLYYYFNEVKKKFYFSSLVKPLLLSINQKQLNLEAIESYSNFNRNDLNETYFKNIFKVLPGELIIFENQNLKKIKLLRFNFRKDNIKDLSNEVTQTFSKQFISDVPVALSLSGGIDSNLILSQLLKNKNNNFNTYSVFFEGSKKFSKDFDIAKDIAKENDLNFNPVGIKPSDFIETADKIVDIVEEPVGNTNSVANYILSKNVNEKVLFSGDGGDEVFTGYDRYKSIHKINLLNCINPFKKLNLKFKNKNINRFFLKNSKELFLSFSEQNLFKNQNKVYKNFRFFKIEDLNNTLNHSLNMKDNCKLSSVMYHDLDTWVQNDILLRNDKIYANSSVELRVPFLDQNIIENYLMIDDQLKYGPFMQYKYLLKKTFKNQLKVNTKIKLGFNSPFSGLLRNELYNFAKDILSKDYHDSSDILNLSECNKLLEKHKNTYNDPFQIWNLISLQIFLRKHNF
tara:strand:- start:1768 stop:3549 length:1782 start_codon:yes stop_codon:yes gene_type:complete